jgi:hypothetical protein
MNTAIFVATLCVVFTQAFAIFACFWIAKAAQERCSQKFYHLITVLCWIGVGLVTWASWEVQLDIIPILQKGYKNDGNHHYYNSRHPALLRMVLGI